MNVMRVWYSSNGPYHRIKIKKIRWNFPYVNTVYTQFQKEKKKFYSFTFSYTKTIFCCFFFKFPLSLSSMVSTFLTSQCHPSSSFKLLSKHYIIFIPVHPYSTLLYLSHSHTAYHSYVLASTRL